VGSTNHVKTVLFLSSWFPNRTAPFNGDFVERHAMAVSDLCKTVVIHVAADESIHGFFLEIHEINNKELTEYIIYFKRSRLPIKLLASLVNNFYYAIGYVKGYLLMKARYGKPDIIHANIIYPVIFVARWIRRFTGIPYIVGEHWTVFLTVGADHIISHPGIRNSVRQAAALVPVTDNLKNALIKLGFNNRYFVVPNVVDTEVFKPSIKTGSKDKIRYLHVSSMKEEHKNVSGIIRTVSRLAQQCHNFVFTFVGDAEPHQIKLAEESGLAGFIEFTGEIPHSQVAAIMQESDVFVMFSRIENLPCVILEALSCGLPVISSDTGGIAGWINDSNGLLVKPEDEDALLKAFLFMHENHSSYNGNTLHQFAVDHFSPEIIAQQFLDIYNKVLNSPEHV
jgi:glycosyltransferase involved in cell wall biosynthesis